MQVLNDTDTLSSQELLQELTAQSEALERHTEQLHTLLQGLEENKTLTTLDRVKETFGFSKGGLATRQERQTARDETIRKEIVEVERLLRRVAQTEDHATLPPDLRQIVRRRLQDAQSLYLRAVKKYPLDQARAAYTEYLEYVIQKCAYVDPRGIRQTVRSVTLPLEDVYVSLTAEQETEALDRWRDKSLEETNEDYRARIAFGRERPAIPVELAPTVKSQRRIVLLGDPGAGKTTLLRFLAYQFAKARREGRTNVRVRDDDYGLTRLPILIRIAAYADAYHQSDKTLDLRTFLPQAFADVPTDKSYLADLLFQALDKGDALVLLDGLDEIIEPGDRSEIGRRIEEFVRAHPNNAFLVTSRIAGYAEARLGGPFTDSTYTLRDMERKQVEQFLAQWCQAVERFHRPEANAETLMQAAHEQQEGILRAYDDSEGVRRIAKNPLLLTILALFHRNGTRLPEQRTKLYELATDTLLRTWRPAHMGSAAAIVTVDEENLLLTQLARRMHDEESTGLISEDRAMTILAETLANRRKKEPNSEEIRLLAAACLGDCREADQELAQQTAKALVDIVLDETGISQYEQMFKRIGAALCALRSTEGYQESNRRLLATLYDLDLDASVRGAAAGVLGQSGKASAEVVSALLEALRDEDYSVRESASEALRMVVQRAEDETTQSALSLLA